MLEGLLLSGLVVGIVAVIAVVSEARKKRLAATAAALGLRRGREREELVGEFDGVPVRRHTYVISTGKTSQTFTQYRAGGLPPGVTLKRENFGTGLLKVFGAEDHRLGDDALDAALLVKGHAPTALALFPEDARRRMLLLLAGGRSVFTDGGELVLQVGRDELAEEPVRAGLTAVADVVRAMRLPPGGVPERLAALVREDPLPAIRRHAVVRLAELGGAELGGAGLRAAIGPALLDPVASVRHAAAIALDDRPTLRALLDAPDLPASERVAVLATLADPALVRRAIALLGDDDPAVAAAAAAVVGATGSVADVPLLHSIEGSASDRAVRRACADAVRAIQARLHDVDAGRIALAGPTGGGEIALAAGEAASGRVAVAGALPEPDRPRPVVRPAVRSGS